MDTRTLIFVIIGIVIAGTIIIFALLDVVFVCAFNTIFKKHHKSLAVMLNVKYDNLVKLYNLILDNGYEIPSNIANLYISIQRNVLNDPESKECHAAHKNLTYIRDELFFFIRSETSLNENEDYVLFKENLSDLDNQYRNLVYLYNADCIGYNFWISFWPTRWIWKLLKFKTRDLINL